MKPSILIIVLFFVLSSCGPKIYNFTTIPLTITNDDSIFVKWRVRGKPTLIVHNKNLQGSGNADNNQPHESYQELTLVAERNGKEVKSKKQVSILPKDSKDVIVFNTTLNGDTLIAEGINNEETWNNKFEISSVASASNRTLIVTHADKKQQLNASGTFSNTFEGTPVKGYWAFKSLLTPEEKKDLSLAPASLKINITIKYKP